MPRSISNRSRTNATMFRRFSSENRPAARSSWVEQLVPRLCLGTHCVRGSASRVLSGRADLIHEAEPRWQRVPRQIPGTSALPPIGNYLQQAFPSRIITRARITPMCGIIDVSASHGIVLHVLELLDHHIIALELLRVASLLPELVRLTNLVSQFVKPNFLEQCRET